MVDDLIIHLLAPEPPAVGHNVTAIYDRELVHSRFSVSALTDSITHLQHALAKSTPDPDLMRQAGCALFDKLLGGTLFRIYSRALDKATAERPLRLCIYSDQPGLIAIPWEYLYDRDQGQWLALRPELSLVRGLPAGRRSSQQVNEPLRVLVMISAPTDLPQLNSERELANLYTAEATGMVEIFAVPPTYDDLQAALREHNPHIFHFIGHGTFANTQAGQTAGVRHIKLSASDTSTPSTAGHQGLLALCHKDGTTDLIEAERLAPLLVSYEMLGLILLNACQGSVTGVESAFAGLTQHLIQQQIPAVIAMQAPIFDEHAVRFSREFYAALAAGSSVEAAVSEGRKAIHGVAYSWGIPTFYLQASEPFAIQPLPPLTRANQLWQKAQRLSEISRQRALLEGVLNLDPSHPGAKASLTELRNEEEASHLYAEAVTYMKSEQWRDAHRTLEQIRKLVSNFRDTDIRLAEVLGKLSPSTPPIPPGQIDQPEQYRPIFNALQEGRLTLFLGDDVGRIGRPAEDHWVEGLYPPGAEDAARALARYLPLEFQREASLLRVSQYTQLLDGEYALYQRLSTLYAGDYQPTPLHRLLARLPTQLAAKDLPRGTNWRYVLFSTALDDLLEQAFADAGQPYHLFAYRPRFVDDNGVTQLECFLHIPPATSPDAATPQEVLRPNEYNEHDEDRHPIIVKLCGRRVTDEPASAAVTEDHYLNYISTETSLAVLPTTLLTQIKRNNFLFFGHSLRQWHLRLLWQRLRLPNNDRQPPRWAIVPELSQIDERFWRNHGIDPLVAQPEGVVAYVHDWLERL